ncbi:MAG: bifunctional histidinol-phosphatase/imidazoleglycerol-phosphate dehydratase HisB [Blastocatellia bacterium]|nr:bifunctional histidinol-phosphatase/imidazoleglycerol-phosphate dehydratase HisB [Blastocatellia bacterium]
MKRALFIDRDGTLIAEPEDFQVDSFAKLRFLPGVFTWLGRIAAETDYDLVMVTNQDGLGTDAFPEENFAPVQAFIVNTLAAEGIEFTDVLIDRSFEHEAEPSRKPGTGMLTRYMQGDYNLANSFVIGDRLTDVQLAANLGAKAIFIENGNFTAPVSETIALKAAGWREIYDFLRNPPRTATVHRKTNETDINIELNLDGTGRSEISTGIPFFDHMLDQLARHGSLDLRIAANGDLEIDEHHTIEDVAITLGDAFAEALADKRGLARYGFCLPMDDCLAQVALDFGGRNWIVWDAEFKREKIGEMPTEMFVHFFKSFTDSAKCNLNIKAEGTNEHHKIEAIFKAFARSIKMAVRREGEALPSTKGVI